MTLPPTLDTGPQKSTAFHRGIEYSGEVIRAARWSDVFGAQLEGDSYFRVVLLEGWPAGPPPAELLRDQRTAVCVIGHQPGITTTQVGLEMRAVREAQIEYLARSLVAETTLREVARQMSRLEERIAQIWGQAYQEGQVVANPPLEVDREAVFGSGGAAQWAERLGALLLARAYSEAPLRPEMPQPFNPWQQCPLLFDGLLMSQPATEAREAVARFAPALGLALRDAPMAETSWLLPLIEQEMEAAGGRVQGDWLGWRLAHVHGLTYPLATLFTLLSLLHGKWVVQLRPGHALTLRNGSLLASKRLTGAQLLELRWPTPFWEHVEWVGPAAEDTWERALPYLRVLDLPSDPASVWEDNLRRTLLGQWLGQLQESLLVVAEQLEALANAQGTGWDPAKVPWLAQLRTLSRLQDPQGFLVDAEGLFGDPGQFGAAVQLWRGWTSGVAAGEALARGMDYLELSVVPEGLVSLYTERQLLLERLRAAELLTSPRQWPGLADEVAAFQRHYATAYLQHHEAYHTEMTLLGHRMADIRVQSRALERLNAIPQLGMPVAEALPPLVEELYNTIAGCSGRLTLEGLQEFPRCRECGLRLVSQPPIKDVESLGSYVRQALAEQNRRLSGILIHRLVQGEQSEEIDRFIKVVQVSDLSGLAQVLDDEVVQFISDMLGIPGS